MGCSVDVRDVGVEVRRDVDALLWDEGFRVDPGELGVVETGDLAIGQETDVHLTFLVRHRPAAHDEVDRAQPAVRRLVERAVFRFV